MSSCGPGHDTGRWAWRYVRRSLLAVAIVVAIGADAQAQAAFPGDDGLIAFTGTNGCPGDQAAIGLIRPDGQDRRMVTP